MYGLRRFGIKLGLSTIRGLLEGLGNPQQRFSCIHIAGSNGKGSIAAMLASILETSGRRVGLYTSPHLVRFNERIRINGEPISDADVVSAHQAVNDARTPGEARHPTFFEYATAMAFHEFAERKVDWAVIETGMGGRLDATNVIVPALSIISNISMEHRMYLGDTLAEIASEKGGIIKKGVPVVTGVRQRSVVSVLENIARDLDAPFHRAGRAFRVRRKGTRAFNYYGLDNAWRDLTTGLTGRHQVDNAALALAACEILNQNGMALSLAAIQTGMGRTRWPGRLEIVSESPLILLDGAHNLAAAKNLARYLAEELADREITLVVGILDDKQYKGMLESLLPFCKTCIITRPVIDRALPPEKIRRTAARVIDDVRVIDLVPDAVEHAVESAKPGEAICIAGSLYVVGEAMELFEKKGLKKVISE